MQESDGWTQALVKPSVRRDLLAEKLAYVEYVGGNKFAPMIHLDERVVEELRAPWKEALIIKLLGKNVGYKAMWDRVQALWKLQARFEMKDMGYGFFVVKFDMMEDESKVMTGGPWMLFDHYLISL